MRNRRPDDGPEPQRVDALGWLLVGLVLVPLMVEAVHVVSGLGTFHATSDNASNELVVRDIGRYPVLLGPFARLNWSHPGPLLYYLLWAPYRVFGSNSSAMLQGALLINGGAIVAMIAIAKRWGGYLLAVPVAFACGLVVVRLPSGYLEDPWNPYVTVLAFGAFLMVAWAVTCGDRWAAPLAVFIGSFCVQTHVGYAALVAAVSVVCVWCIVRDRDAPRVRGDGRRGLVPLVWAAAVLVVVWAPPLVEQLTRSPGNVGSIVTYFRSPPQPTHGLADGFWVIAAQFGPAADWIRGLRSVLLINGQPVALTEHPLPLLLVPFLVACAWAFWRGPSLCAAWRWSWCSPSRSGSSRSPTRSGRCTSTDSGGRGWSRRCAPRSRSRRVPHGCAPASGGRRGGRASCWRSRVWRHSSWPAPRTPQTAPAPNAKVAALVRSLMRQVATHLPDRPGVVLVRATSARTTTYLPGATLGLERDGVDVKVKNDRVHLLIFGEHRLYQREPVRALLAICEDRGIERMAIVPGARMIGYEGRVSPADRTRALRELARRWRARENDAAHPTNAQLVADTWATAVFELPPSGAGFSVSSR